MSVTPTWLQTEIQNIDLQYQKDRDHFRIRNGVLETGNTSELAGIGQIRFTTVEDCPILHPVAIRTLYDELCKVVCADRSEWMVFSGRGGHPSRRDAYNLLKERADPLSYLMTDVPSYYQLLAPRCEWRFWNDVQCDHWSHCERKGINLCASHLR